MFLGDPLGSPTFKSEEHEMHINLCVYLSLLLITKKIEYIDKYNRFP